MDVFRVCCFTSVFLLGFIIQANGREFTPPRIFPEGAEYISGPNVNFNLTCEGKEPITWKLPNNSLHGDIEPKYSTITISSSETTDSEYTFGSILTIQNVSYLDVGFYYCLGETTDLEDLFRVSNIYIYVDDPEQLSVLPEYPDAIVVPQYSEVILPCRPTSPNVDVTLTQTTALEEINNVSYDPKIGYKLFTNDLLGHFIYSCQFTRKNNSGNDTVYDLDILLFVITLTESIAKPFLEELSGGHTVVGEKLKLKCTIRFEMSTLFHMEWKIPDQQGLTSGRIRASKTITASHDTYYQELTINETILDDQGEYVCVVKDYRHENNHTKFIRIYNTDEHFINLTEENEVYDISVQAGEPIVQWRIDVKAHPLPTLVWYNHNGKEIPAGSSDNNKYNVNTEGSTETILVINDITILDRGVYLLKAINGFDEKILKLSLNVTDKPTVQIKTANFHMINEPSKVECSVAAYPEPSIYWFYKNCEDDSCDFQPQLPSNTEMGMLSKSYLYITANQSGYVMCTANNSLGQDESVVGFVVTDVINGFGIWGLDNDTVEEQNGTSAFPIAVGETITIYCAASRYNYTNQLAWFKKDGNDKIALNYSDRYIIDTSSTKFSNKITLSIRDATSADSGNYTCQVEKLDMNIPSAERLRLDSITVAVRDPESPIIFETNMNDTEYSMDYPDKFQFWCYARGVPKPTIAWYKNGEEVVETTRITLQNNNRILNFERTEPDDEGSYMCQASNKVRTVEKRMKLLFKNKPGFNYKYVLIILAMTVLFIASFLYMFLRFRKERELRRELKRAGLANFENGALESLNPELGVDDQAELLPYDKKWEFPREKLKLGKQLGSGAFGVVLKADATGITEGEESTTVAVKMVKRNADYTFIKALASELKIMVHLGKHLNVVNLVGACTKNVAKRELLVIVEYCRYGNLHNYLLRHRESFIDQIDPKTGKIDYTFGAEILERSFSVSSKFQNPNVKYAAISFSNSNSSPVPNSSMADYRGNFNYTGETANTASTVISVTPSAGGEDSLITSNNSAQPEWRSNYRGDYKGNVKPICTKDLITWAFQVARGMEYLASRKVLHGDLAARNILLAENNVVKICDFGLAKSMYKSENYKKKGDGPLPVKWMAVESIRDRVFSTQSDIWSYGIVLWEFFSLARTPYPGMEVDERLYNKLVDGYRMDSPEFATNEIYKMMCECWHPKPQSRPSFTKLVETIGYMLEESVRQHYVDLNDPYLVMNTQRLENGHSDYLAMLSPPDFEHLSSPHHYVNEDVLPNASPNPTEIPGYLCMKTSNIFSPRLDEGNVFTFDVEGGNKKHKNSNGEIASGVELLPILHTQNESDCETPNLHHTPKTPTSFSNPSYHMPPRINEKTDADIVKSADNYVNMPQNKNAIKSENTTNNINPSTKSNNYVNSNSRDWERIQV